MPSGEPAPPPSAATVAWNWVIEELAGCKEFDTSIFAALLRWDRGVVEDPIFGGRTMVRLVLKYLEELADSTLPPPPSPASAAAAPVPGSEVLDHRINAASSSESILFHLSQEVGALNGTGNCVSESCSNLLRQLILEKKAALHKSPIDLGSMFEHCCEGDLSSNVIRCLVGGNQRNPMHTDNTDDHITVAKKLKLDNSHVQQEKLPPAISAESNQGLLLKEATFSHENQLSEQNIQIGQDDNNVCSTRKSSAPQFPVEKDKMPQISSPVKTGNNMQIPAVSSDDGQKIVSDSSSDSEGYYAAPEFHLGHEVIAGETLKLLNSQNPVNNDSQIGDWTRQGSCVKCDEGGQVLICTGSECPIVVHESCLGLSVGAEKPEEFICPFCSYLVAASAYREARKKVSVARKNLSSFLDRGQMGLNKVKLPTSLGESSHARKSPNRDHLDKVCVNKKSEIDKEPERQNQAKAAINGDDGNFPGELGNTLIDRNYSAAPSGEAERVNEYYVVSTSQNKAQAVATTISDGHAQHTVPLHKGKSCTDKGTSATTKHLPGEQENACVNKVCHADVGASKIMERTYNFAGSASRPTTPVVPAIGSASRPATPVVPATWSASRPTTPVVPATGSASCPVASSFPSQSPPEVESHHPAAEEAAQLPGRQPCWISGGKIDPGSASRYITSLVHAHVPGLVDSWKEFPWSVRDLLFDMFTRRYMFTRPEDLPRARVVWEYTAQTNFRKSMWEARDKAAKTTGSQDPTTWMDYGPVWMRRDYWESLCHRWATGPWQERSQAVKRNRAAHPEKNVHTSGLISYATHNQKLRHELERPPTIRELFDRTYKRKETDDYVSESARTIAETYDRTMTDRYADGTPQPDLDPEAWVDTAGGPRKVRVYGFGDSLDTTPVLSSYASSVASPAYASSSAVMPDSGREDIRTLIREELQLHFGAMVEQLMSVIRGVGPSQQAPQDPLAPDDDHKAGTADDPADLS